jgi:hypothetical protein
LEEQENPIEEHLMMQEEMDFNSPLVEAALMGSRQS